MKFYCLLVCFSLVIIASCNRSNQSTKYNRKSIELQGFAVHLIQNNQYDSALILLDKAIKLDTTYYLAYADKVEIFLKLKDFNHAISESKQLLNIKPDFAEGWQFEGLIYDLIGDSVNAIKDYYKSIDLFSERLLDPQKKKYIFNNKLNIAVSLLLARQEKSAYDSLRKIKEQYPDQITGDEFLKLSRKDLFNQLMDNK
jgi:tetratricopeptide (TPR) repeat protein